MRQSMRFFFQNCHNWVHLKSAKIMGIMAWEYQMNLRQQRAAPCHALPLDQQPQFGSAPTRHTGMGLAGKIAQVWGFKSHKNWEPGNHMQGAP